MEQLLLSSPERISFRSGEVARYWTAPFRALHLVRAELISTEVDASARLGRAQIMVHATAMNTNDSRTGDERIVVFNLQAHDRNDRNLPMMEPKETHELDLPMGPMINHYELEFALEGLELSPGETLWLTVLPLK